MTTTNSTTSTTEQITLAAMCLWEEVIERGGYLNAFPDHEEVGTCAARDTVSALAAPCDRAWMIAHTEGSFEDAFDWEFVPWFLENCVDSDGTLSTRWETTTRQTFCN